MDDLVLNVKQIGQYPTQTTVAAQDLVLVQSTGLGGPYMSMLATDMVVTSWLISERSIPLQPGTGITWNGSSLTWNAKTFTFTDPVNVPSLSSTGDIFVAGEALANQTWVTGLFDNILENSVTSFNGRIGAVQLTVQDVMRAGAAPTINPHFAGVCTAPTIWNYNDNSDNIATTSWVQHAILNAVTNGCIVGSINGRGGCVVLDADDISTALSEPGSYATANTPPSGDTSKRIATTAFVDDAVAGVQETVLSNLSGIAAQLDQQYAPINSPQFTGVPTAPTASPGSSTGQLATTAFVAAAVTASTTGVSSFNTRTGAVVLTGGDVTNAGGALLASPAFTGNPTAPTQAPGDSSSRLATTSFVQAEVATVNTGVTTFNSRTGAVNLLLADVTAVGGAPLASPALSGVPTSPTAAPTTNTTQIATTAFVTAAIAAMPAPVSSFNGRTGAVSFQASDLSAVGGALLASPAFTGNPQGVTRPPGDSSVSLATTAFVQNALTGVVSGVSSFNTRTGAVTLTAADVTGVGGALLASPVFTGVPAAPTAAPGTNSTQLASTAFVTAAIAASPGGVTSFNSRTGAITLQGADVSAAGGALLASPAFTGTPTSTTAAPTDNSTRLATTAFVAAAIAAGGGVTTFNGRAGAVVLSAADIISATGATYAQADAAPAVGPNNTLWFDSTKGQLFVQYTDPVSSARTWVIANSPAATTPAPASGSRVLLAQQIVSGTPAAVNFFYNFANAAYDLYELEFHNMQISSTSPIVVYMHCSADGSTFDGGSNYAYSSVYSSTGTTANAGGSYASGQGGYPLTGNTDSSSAPRRHQGSVRIFNAGVTSLYKNFMSRCLAWSGTTGLWQSLVTGEWQNATVALQGVGVFPASGTFTAGTFNLYGIAK